MKEFKDISARMHNNNADTLSRSLYTTSTYAKTKEFPKPQPVFKGSAEKQEKLKALYQQQEAKEK